MGRKVKAVPEWLNSPIWAAPPPATAPADPFGADFSRPLAPPPEPPPPVPPPPTYEQAVGSYASRERETREEEGAGAALRAHLLADFKSALSKKTVNMGELRRLACLGVPDGGGDVRPPVWKLLLGYLPTERSLWPYELEKKRSQYSAYKDEFLLNPSEKLRRIEESKLSRKKELNIERNGLLPRLEVSNEEHPLSSGKSSLWNQYFQLTANRDMSMFPSAWEKQLEYLETKAFFLAHTLERLPIIECNEKRRYIHLKKGDTSMLG